MVPTVAPDVTALRVDDRHASDSATAPPRPLDGGAAGADQLLPDEVSPAVERAVMELARLIAAGARDDSEALAAIARVASRLAAVDDGPPGPAAARHDLDDDLPVPAVGAWSLSNGMLNVILGEN